MALVAIAGFPLRLDPMPAFPFFRPLPYFPLRYGIGAMRPWSRRECCLRKSATGRSLGKKAFPTTSRPLLLETQRRSLHDLGHDNHLVRPRYDPFGIVARQSFEAEANEGEGGKRYTNRQQLWESVESMERQMSEDRYPAAERLPANLLPAPADRHRQRLPGGESSHIPRLQPQPVKPRGVARLCQIATMDEAELAKELAGGSRQQALPLNENQDGRRLLSGDAEGGNPLTSNGALEDSEGPVNPAALALHQLLNVGPDERLDLATTATGSSVPAVGIDSEVEDVWRTKERRTKPVAAWSSTKLDPFLCRRAKELYGGLRISEGGDAAPDAPAEDLEKAGATQAQLRLLSALLDPAHRDVMFSSDVGTGKSTALVLAALHGCRCEAAGLNVLLAKDEIGARRLKNMATSICGDYGGRVVDRPVEDMSWIFLAEDAEDAVQYTAALHNMADLNPNGPPRLLVTTPKILCEMLFRFKKHERLCFEKFGYLRRVFVDDGADQIAAVHDGYVSFQEIRHREDNPSALELLLATLHQGLPPGLRAILQMGVVAAQMPTRFKEHLEALCLKPDQSTFIMTAEPFPSGVETIFSFRVPLKTKLSESQYLVGFLRNLNPTIPGRAVLLFPPGCDLLEKRLELRKLGMEAAVLSEVYDSSTETFQETLSGSAKPWKFLLLHEADALHLQVPFVSHVVFTYPPANRYALLHMAKRIGIEKTALGWMCVVCDQTNIKQVHRVASELGVSAKDNTVTMDLEPVDEEKIWSMVKPYPLYGQDPQLVVMDKYNAISESIYKVHSEPVGELLKEDYTAVEQMEIREINARLLRRDLIQNPAIAGELRELGYLNNELKPTKQLRQAMKDPYAMQRPDGEYLDLTDPFRRRIRYKL